MIDFSTAELGKRVVHGVGNKLRDEKRSKNKKNIPNKTSQYGNLRLPLTKN